MIGVIWLPHPESLKFCGEFDSFSSVCGDRTPREVITWWVINRHIANKEKLILESIRAIIPVVTLPEYTKNLTE